ncbi:MAG TPA: glycoside hydrolase family 15 protein [Chthoniobacterales bacterium]|nr:glycoside hydrolase family 15 protein [Chthoniobacterales bacterium]
MSGRRKIEDYAFLSDTQTGALVSRDGSVDWLCVPRFDSGACFAALLGDEQNGRWSFRPRAKVKSSRRRYRPGTLILETEIETSSGLVRLIDFMPPRGTNPDIVRIIEGIRGRVRIEMNLTIRFGYGNIVPWVRKRHGGLEAIAGPDAVILHTPVGSHGKDLTTVAEFTVGEGDRIPFVLTWFASNELPPREVEPEKALRETERYWTDWSNRCALTGEWHEAVLRSLITLKGLTYAPTGGIVAAATTSLPEQIGGVRNWDYRFCWLRDATFTLFALMGAGYLEEARAWREWLLRAVAGSPGQMQIMYGVCGERRLEEYEIPWLRGYANSKPVRIGNAASRQRQLDVYGEVMDSMYHAHRAGIETDDADWRLQSALVEFLESRWDEPDEGIWEVRGGPRNFTHSKMMAWVAFDRIVKLGEIRKQSAQTDVKHWRKLRDKIHREVCRCGYDRKKKAFMQSYGSDQLDAALLMMPLVGFLPARDPRVRNTIDAIKRELMQDGFVLRYRPQRSKADGLPGSEGAFLPCSFWLANCLHLIGRTEEARELFERLLTLRNDLGLLSEEYDPVAKRQLGNFPQAFSHVALVNTAQILGQHAATRKAAKAAGYHRRVACSPK